VAVGELREWPFAARQAGFGIQARLEYSAVDGTIFMVHLGA